MKKKLFSLFISLFLVLTTCFACADIPKFTLIKDYGTYSGYKIELVKFENTDTIYLDDVRKIIIDDVYIDWVGIDDDFIVYTKGNKWVRLKEAYEQEIISHDVLLELAEVCAGQRPTFSERIDVGIYSRYKVEYAEFYCPALYPPLNRNDLIIDDVYLTTASTLDWNFIVVTGVDEWIYLDEAYKQGLITHDDLLAIAEKMSQQVIHSSKPW